MSKLYILGGNGNGLVMAAAIDRNKRGWEIQFLNDFEEIGTMIGKYKKLPIVGRPEQAKEMLQEEGAKIMYAFGTLKNPEDKLRRITSLNIKKDQWLSFVDETAVVPIEYCEIEEGCFVGPLAQLSPNVLLNRHCCLMGNSYVGHDSEVGEFSMLASNSVVGSYVKVGRGVHIGTNACIREHVEIGDYSVIGAGAVVIKDLPARAIVVGNPAKILRYRED